MRAEQQQVDGDGRDERRCEQEGHRRGLKQGPHLPNRLFHGSIVVSGVGAGHADCFCRDGLRLGAGSSPWPILFPLAAETDQVHNLRQEGT